VKQETAMEMSGECMRMTQAKGSAKGILFALRWAPALPGLQPLRGRIAGDEQAVAFAAALAAFTSIAQARAVTSLARCGQFFIHELAFPLRESHQ
jgi:hypothetical protein